MPVLNATQSQSIGDILDSMIARLKAHPGLGATTLKTQIVIAPDDQMPEHLGEPGYRLRVSPPQPNVMCGAGRLGWITERRVDVYVITENLLDPGGQDGKALKRHVLKEDAVIDALLLSPPSSLPYAQTISLVGDLSKQLPGGDALSRLLKDNPGLIVSMIPFAITYVPKIVVLRDGE